MTMAVSYYKIEHAERGVSTPRWRRSLYKGKQSHFGDLVDAQQALKDRLAFPIKEWQYRIVMVEEHVVYEVS